MSTATNKKSGINGFKSIKVIGENTDRNDEWAKEEAAKIGEERFRREHGCEFITADETLINQLKLISVESKRFLQTYRTNTLVQTYCKR